MSDKVKASSSKSPGASPSTEEPAKKKAKKNAMQTNLFSFFSSSSESKQTQEEDCNKKISTPTKQSETKKVESASPAVKTDSGASQSSDAKSGEVPDPIVPSQVPPPRNVLWLSLHDDIVIIRKPTNEKPRTKVAAFDLDGTLINWSTSFSGFWPSQLSHYELWSSTVPGKLRALHDEGYKLVLISNQGGIQKAHKGKKATLVKGVMDWLANLIDRPVHAVMSTKTLKKSENSFHKPTPKMWQVVIDSLNKREEVDISQSFFVGDSADPDDNQGGVDLKFAQAVGKENPLQFYTPDDYFGPSDSERRQKAKGFEQLAESPPPKEALQARSALLGGYLQGPILLILCGVQGSGKSTFCQQLLKDAKDDHWIHLSQDTINKGKPGKREKVEEEARAALERGHSVVVDRMHLDPGQRSYFVEVAKSVKVAAHGVLLNPPKEVIAKRVKERTNHPGKVQGEEGARRALQSVDKMVMPTYSEELQLISCASTPAGVSRLANFYKCVAKGCSIPEPLTEVPLSDTFAIPSIALGTMGIGKKITKTVVLSVTSVGFRAIDTAPTYKNEDRVGDALEEIASEIFCVAKIPKKATQPEDVRSELEATLKNLRLGSVHLLLLHWPCDVIAAGTLAAVWKEMEQCYKEGKCKALGVCNFNTNALAMLLCNCSIPPLVNQVERHPFLSQMDIFDFCARNNILVQAHTPLGQGKEELLANPVITRISKEASMTPSQVVLRWNLQQGVLVTPKCSTEEHAKELLSSSMLSSEQMKALDSLDKGKRFVNPPFMYGSASFCWGKQMPRK
jgi:DNA 3'-phosphatase